MMMENIQPGIETFQLLCTITLSSVLLTWHHWFKMYFFSVCPSETRFLMRELPQPRVRWCYFYSWVSVHSHYIHWLSLLTEYQYQLLYGTFHTHHILSFPPCKCPKLLYWGTLQVPRYCKKWLQIHPKPVPMTKDCFYYQLWRWIFLSQHNVSFYYQY